MRFIAVADTPEDAKTDLAGIDSLRIKPRKFDQQSGREWVQLLQNTLSGRVAAS
jgi:hypothetical protein